MVFNGNNYLPAYLSFYIHDSVLSRVLKFKYLGRILTPALCDELDINKNLKSFTKSFGMLFRKFYLVDSDI